MAWVAIAAPATPAEMLRVPPTVTPAKMAPAETLRVPLTVTFAKMEPAETESVPATVRLLNDGASLAAAEAVVVESPNRS